MSEAIAIPATTFVLSKLLEERISADYGSGSIGVMLGPPPRPPTSSPDSAQAEPPGLILYMHHAAPNTSWRNMYEPRMSSSGKLAVNAPLVLDLHYLLAATGSDLRREVALSIGMGAFNRFAIIPRGKIEKLIKKNTVADSASDNIFERIGAEKIWLQAEQITITPQPLDLDLSTKLWSALQAPMRPSAHYLVTTVFLEAVEEVPEPKIVEQVSIYGRPNADPSGPPSEHIDQTEPALS